MIGLRSVLMLKRLLLLLAIVSVLGCVDAPTEGSSAIEAEAFRPMPTFVATGGGQFLYVVIPDIGAGLTPDEQLIATGRTGSVDINECDGNPVTAARYAALTGAGREGGYSKMHFSTDVGAGTKMSKLQPVTTCFSAGT